MVNRVRDWNSINHGVEHEGWYDIHVEHFVDVRVDDEGSLNYQHPDCEFWC